MTGPSHISKEKIKVHHSKRPASNVLLTSTETGQHDWVFMMFTCYSYCTRVHLTHYWTPKYSYVTPYAWDRDICTEFWWTQVFYVGNEKECLGFLKANSHDILLELGLTHTHTHIDIVIFVMTLHWFPFIFHSFGQSNLNPNMTNPNLKSYLASTIIKMSSQ